MKIITSELPVFNLYKLHGSVTWKSAKDEGISLDATLDQLHTVSESHVKSSITIESLVATAEKTKLDSLIEKIKEEKLISDDKIKKYLREYDSLSIINPTKDKFKSTTLNYTYYELLRMFSNELERESNALFVLGFSFADEHIREIILRSIKTNPTLIVIVFAYDDSGEADILKNFSFASKENLPNNLIFIGRTGATKEDSFNLKKITQYFKDRLHEVLEEK